MPQAGIRTREGEMGDRKGKVTGAMASMEDSRPAAAGDTESGRKGMTPSGPASTNPAATVSKPRFTKEMREDGWTILCPQMAPIHFDLIQAVVRSAGYNLVLLPSVDRGAVDAGLRYVNNDICYPSILVTGQIMEAIESGRYDLSRTAVVISQTGGGCRATNYIALIRKALRDSRHADIPVISLALSGGLDEDNPGFDVMRNPKVLTRLLRCLLFGDLVMQCLYRTRPYEEREGSADALYDEVMGRAKVILCGGSKRDFRRMCQNTVNAFDELPLAHDREKPRIGIVGEILVKFHPTANNQLVRQIEDEGCEAVVPGLTDFFLFTLANPILIKDEIGSSRKKRMLNSALIGIIDAERKPIDAMLRDSRRFEPATPIMELADKARDILSACNTFGEGWLLTAEIVELIGSGCPNVVCVQPFACLPNHIVGKAVLKEMRRRYPKANVAAIDYDPGASEANQLNRLKLMVTVAKENFRNE